MKITVMGAGAWGTALAISLAEKHQVILWGRDANQVHAMQTDRENTRYLPGIAFPSNLSIDESLGQATQQSDLVLVVTPTAGLRPSLNALVALQKSCPVVWACKGLEVGSMLPPHAIADTILPPSIPRGVLSGPSFAQEVATGLPAALTLAAEDAAFANHTSSELHGRKLRVYSSTDVVGVEIGGAVKNVMAIAAGVCDGLKLGNNARAALITRGLAEITRLGAALGAKAETFTGLSGLGDLLLTCTGDLSRNRKVGLLLAQGQTLAEVLANLGHVAEGVNTAKEVLRQANTHSVDMPITAAVCRLLFENVSAAEIVAELMEREHKQEV
ncbi:NAD(P)H-dependent glycerol-3-phosphate dehydrogenase [Parachitinimonas caeni]|uniref:Glycerol-3-phosphate dehydrogenase [NAD(P)+] n=1 Tax=Parachitinimonas caeni TaxID=3031301 RepID=A0ABT7DVQ0_9NEIS|nr:NAD(P)H-dependent glycerol-3-phosphate dehydrogenase [Parachitinimonas caeni]MDK2124125.1 NAD(P)-dependent glycerol-3-phosphate dehydrogenase [Parachitinimonas caeni]